VQVAILHKKSNCAAGGGMFSDMYAGQFAKAFVGKWEAWMSGIVFVFFGAWVLFFEPRNETLKTIFLWLAVAGFVFSFYQVWVGEHEKFLAEKAKNLRPRFKAEIKQVAVGVIRERSDVAVVTVFASIRNLGMPSVGRAWALLVRVPDKGILNGVFQYQQGRLLLFQEHHDPIVHRNEDVLYNKIAEQPLVTGGEVTGTLAFHLEGVTKEDVYRKGTVFVLVFEDVIRRPYFAVRVLRVEEEPPQFFPGMKSATDPKLKKNKWKRPPDKAKQPPSS